MIPAFTLVLVLIWLLLSHLLKAVRVPIVNTPKSIAADYLESIVLNRDGGLRTTPLEPAEPLSRAASDYPIG